MVLAAARYVRSGSPVEAGVRCGRKKGGSCGGPYRGRKDLRTDGTKEGRDDGGWRGKGGKEAGKVACHSLADCRLSYHLRLGGDSNRVLAAARYVRSGSPVEAGVRCGRKKGGSCGVR